MRWRSRSLSENEALTQQVRIFFKNIYLYCKNKSKQKVISTKLGARVLHLQPPSPLIQEWAFWAGQSFPLLPVLQFAI